MAFHPSAVGAMTAAPPTHRGHGFHFGHPQFSLPSQHKPVVPGRIGARSLTPDRMLSGGIRNRHGSAEHGATARERERDRARSPRSSTSPAPTMTPGPVVGDATAQARAYRTQPTGPQEEEEWTSALENVINRLVSIENMQRKHSEQLVKHKDALEIDTLRADWLKRHVDNCYETSNNNYKELSGRHDLTSGLFNEVTTKIHSMDEAIEAVKNLAAQSIAALNHVSTHRNTAPGPVTFDLATPAEPDPQAVPVPSTPTAGGASPFDDGISLPSGGTPVTTAQANAPPRNNPGVASTDPWSGTTHPAKVDPWSQGRDAAVPAMPRSYANAVTAGPPMPFTTPPRGQHSHHPNMQQHFGDGVERQFGICRKRNESLHVFKGTPEDFKGWRDRVVDHCCRTNGMWRACLDYVAQVNQPIKFADLQSMDLQGHSAIEVSKIFFNWVCDFLPLRLYNRRLQLSGREFGNGFELWRRLREKYEGTGAVIDVAGTDCLHAYPRCKSAKDLEEHLDSWEEMLDKYGQSLIEYAPAHVRVMLIKTLPAEIETELFDKPELDTWEKIMDWCRKRLAYKNQKHLASYLRPGMSRVNALRPQDDSDDDDDEPQARAPKGRSVNALVPDMDSVETMVAAIMRKQMKGRRSTTPDRDKTKKRFVWAGGCHECGGDHMKSDCPRWVKLMKDNNNRMPEGHVNAYSKARDTFNKANGIPKPKGGRKDFKKKTHTKALVSQSDDEVDSEFSSTDSEAGFQTAMKAIRTRVCAVSTPKTSVSNSFDALVDNQPDELNEEVLEAFNGWAHKVHRQPKKLAKKLKQKLDVLIEDEAELDAALAENSLLAARLPGETDRQKLMAMMAKAPSPDILQPGEVFAMIDSGSGVDGAALETLLPGVEVAKAERPIICTTANGQEMVADKVAKLRVALDGEECVIPFSDLPLEMPIISVRQHVGSRKHSCRIRNGGGYFRNTQTKVKSRFIEREGVYFMRMKVISQVKDDGQQPFARPGAKA